jgi:ceramide glucosyltransferase
MAIVVGLVLALSVVATGYQLFQLVACRAFFRRARRRAARVKDYRPPVTILKPLKGRGIDLYANLASFCRQDYPEYQIVCGVADPNDPAVDVVRKIQRDFPHRDVALSIGDRPGVNRKVANLRHMMEHAKHAVLALSDADVRVRPDYLRRSVAPLASEKVGLTTCLYRGRGFFGLPSVIESILINCDFVPLVLTAQFIGQRNALGASLVFKREPFERMGGFPRIADHLADDNLLGVLVKEAGLTVETLPYVVETILDSTTLRDVWRHQLRWARTYRLLQPAGWFASVVTHAVPWGLAALVVTRGSLVGLGFFVAALAARLGTLRLIMRMLHERDTPRHLWMVPLKDLGFSAVWLASWLGRDVEWSGRTLRIQRDGRMVPVGATAAAEAVAHVQPVPVSHGETHAA